MSKAISASETNYTKSKHRSRLRDEISSAYLHVKETRDLDDIETLAPCLSFGLDLHRPFLELEDNLITLRLRYLKAKVVKEFLDGATGDVRPYVGHVDQIAWDKGEGCYLFHVVYDDDDDDDEEDMEH